MKHPATFYNLPERIEPQDASITLSDFIRDKRHRTLDEIECGPELSRLNYLLSLPDDPDCDEGGADDVNSFGEMC
jgi:hypothetical protein